MKILASHTYLYHQVVSCTELEAKSIECLEWDETSTHKSKSGDGKDGTIANEIQQFHKYVCCSQDILLKGKIWARALCSNLPRLQTLALLRGPHRWDLPS